MKKFESSTASSGDLVHEYIEIGLQQDDALLNDDTGRYNRLYREREAIDHELRRRGTEARLHLTQLLTHPNPLVRFNAATDCLAVAPQEARLVLEKMRDSRISPYCLYAGMGLLRLDDRTYVPT